MTKVTYNKTISPKENMVAPDKNAYFNTTEKALECIIQGISHSGRSPKSINSVLDFGCGHGRVYRILTAAFPNADHTACDLIEDGARFCAETFGGSWIQSQEDVSQIKFGKKFDLIWIGSVLTHLPEKKWHALLDFLANNTQTNGIMIFSVHGKSAMDFFENNIMKRHPNIIEPDTFNYIKSNLDNIGFYFAPQKEHNFKYSLQNGMKVSSGEYGLTFTTQEWICDMLAKKPEWKLAHYAAPGWGKNHDAVTIVRT